jgi:hypothetical protein
MPRLNQENVARWITQADIDYFTQYVKVWIPFNAWYRAAFNVETDSEAIKAIKTTDNSFRDRLVQLLNISSNDGQAFRSRVGELNRALELKTVRNRGEHITLRVSIQENSQTQSNDTYNSINYHVYRQADPYRIIARVTSVKKGAVLFQYQHQAYDWNNLSKRKDFDRKLSPTQQQQLKNHFDAIAPTVQVNLLTNDDHNCYKMGVYNFIRDEDALCSKIIDVLYSLRNTLFHGEITPDKDTNKVYESAYHILYTLIQALQ